MKHGDDRIGTKSQKTAAPLILGVCVSVMCVLPSSHTFTRGLSTNSGQDHTRPHFHPIFSRLISDRLY
jgi:hypothetical protein